MAVAVVVCNALSFPEHVNLKYQDHNMFDYQGLRGGMCKILNPKSETLNPKARRDYNEF